jgi:hypothetical protein
VSPAGSPVWWIPHCEELSFFYTAPGLRSGYFERRDCFAQQNEGKGPGPDRISMTCSVFDRLEQGFDAGGRTSDERRQVSRTENQ